MSDKNRPSNYISQKLGDLIECPICTGTLSKPKMLLPCMHNFCLPCLERYVKDKSSGDTINCPVCRAPVNIPVGGFKTLPTNYFMENIIELRRLVTPANVRHLCCDICAKIPGLEAEAIRPEMYCVECRQRLCGRCIDVHKTRLRLTSTHQLIRLRQGSSSTTDDASNAAVQSAVEMKKTVKATNCDQHRDRMVSGFCQTCRQLICSVCTAPASGLHKGHELSDLPQMARKLRKQMKKDISTVREYTTDYCRKVEQLQKAKATFIDEVIVAEQEIDRKSNEMVQLIERSRKQLHQQLETIKNDRVRDMDVVQDSVRTTVSMLESVKAFSQEVINKGSNVDVIRLENDFRAQLQEMVSMRPVTIPLVGVQFTCGVNSDHNLLTRMMGELSLQQKKTDSLEVYRQTPQLVGSVGSVDDKSVVGLAVFNSELYVARSKTAEIQIYGADTFKLRRRVSVRDIQQPQDLTSCQFNSCLYICDWPGSRLTRFKPDGSVVESWKLKEKPDGLSLTCDNNVLVTMRSGRQLCEYTPEGVLVRAVPLPAEFDPWHAVQLPIGGYVVCSPRCLTMVDINGKIGSVYTGGGTNRKSVPTSASLDFPSHLAVDGAGQVLVADCNSDRIKLVGSTLTYVVRELLTKENGIHGPRRIHLHRDSGRLYIGLADGKLMAFTVLL